MKRSVVLGGPRGVLDVTAAGVGYAAYTVSAKGNEQDRKAEVIASSRAVDDKFTEVWDRLGERDDAWRRLVASPSSSLSTMVNTSVSDVEKLQAQVAEARALIEAIPSEGVQDAYLAVCDEREESFADTLTEAEEAKPLCDAYALMYAVQEKQSTAGYLLNESITSCNNDKHQDGMALAVEAQANFQACRDSYAQAATLCSNGAITTAYQYFDAAIQLAAMQHELARIGSRGGISSYNAQIKKLEDQQKVVESVSGLPGAAESAVWADAETAYGHFKARAAKAKNLWDDARGLVSAGEV